MADGTTLSTKPEQNDSLPTPDELHAYMKRHAREALERTLAELVGLDEDEKAVWLDSFEKHASERMAQCATTTSLWIDVARDEGRRQLRDQLAASAKTIADSMALARRASRPAPSPSPFPPEERVRFINGAVERFVHGLANAQIAILGRISRGEMPELDVRARAVHVAVAAGRAIGQLLGGVWRGTGQGDVLLARAMREATVDGVNAEFGPVIDGLVGSAN